LLVFSVLFEVPGRKITRKNFRQLEMRLALSFTILLLATPVYAGPPVGNLLSERGVQKEKTEEKVGGLPSAKEPAEEAPRAMLSPNQAPAFV